MSSKLWHWNGKWIGVGRLEGGLLPGWKLGFGTLSWCREHWEDAVSDALIKKAGEKKGARQ